MEPLFAQAAGCQPADLEPTEYSARLSVKCRIERLAAGGLHTQLRLAELADELKGLGVMDLEVELAFTKLRDVTVSPAIPSNENYRIATYTLDDVPREIAVDAGIDPKHVRLLEAGVAGLILLPFTLLLLKPRTLIHLMAATQALFLAGWAAWTWVLLQTEAWTLCELALRRRYAAPLLFFGTPLAAVWIGSELAARQYARLAAAGANVELYRKAKFAIGASVAFLFTSIFAIFASPDDTGGFAWTAIGMGGAIFCVLRLRLASRGSSHPLAPGELRDRIFALAARAGLRLKSVTILTGAETRPPAAFATRWGGILLTDGLLKRLSKREVDAIACHELSHIGPKSRATTMILYALVVATTMTAQFVPGTVMLLPPLLVALALAFKAWRRSEERAADRDSVRWSGDAEAMISGLARVSLSSGMPLDWGAPMSWMLSHPSTGERLRLIAEAGGVPRARVAELIEQAKLEATDHYEEPSALPKQAAFSPMLRQQLSTRLTWYAIAAPALLGVGIPWVLEKAGLGSLMVLAIGAPVSMVAFYAGYEIVVGKIREAARRRAVAKNGDGIFAGFSPSSEPRIYDGMYHYDFGLVRFSPGLCEFLGDRTRFLLDSRLVERIWLGDGPRHWTPRKVTYVECRNPDGMAMVFSLQSFQARMWPWTTRAAQKLYADFEAWRAQHNPALSPSQPCVLPQIKGEPDRSAPLSALARSAAIYAGVGFTASSVLGIANFEQGFDLAPAALCAALAVFAAWPRVMKRRTA